MGEIVSLARRKKLYSLRMRNIPFIGFRPACLTLLTVAAVIAAGHASPAAAPLPDGAGPAVAVDLRAMGDDGRPILDLKREDLTLKVNGKARDIRSLQLIQFGGPSAVTIGPSMPTPYASNVAADAGREVLFAIEDQSIAAGDEQPLKNAVKQIVSGLSPADRVGLVPVTSTAPNLAATSDRDSFGAAVAAVVGHSSANESPNEAICRSKVTLNALNDRFKASTAGAATTIVFFSSGLTPPSGGSTAMLGKKTQGGAGKFDAAADMCTVTTQDYTNVGNAAIASNVNFYVMYVTGTAAATTSKSSSGNDMLTGVQSLAGSAGVQTIMLTGNNDAVLQRIPRDTAAYYVATYDPDPTERTGAPSRIELKAGRDGVKVRTRAEIAVAKSSGAMTPKDMLRTPSVFRDLPLRAVGYVRRNSADDKMVLVLAIVEPAEAGTKMNAASVGLYDQKGKLTVQYSFQPQELAADTLRTLLLVPPGIYRMRVAATDATGRAGTVDYPVTAELTAAAPLKLSSLILGTADPPPFISRMLFGPSTQQAIGVLEINGVAKGAGVLVMLERAATPDGPALGTSDTTISNGTVEDQRLAFGGFGITTLAPGDYVMRALVSVNGQPAGRVIQTLRKTP